MPGRTPGCTAGAGGGIRTHTGLRPAACEAATSASSVTPAPLRSRSLAGLWWLDASLRTCYRAARPEYAFSGTPRHRNRASRVVSLRPERDGLSCARNRCPFAAAHSHGRVHRRVGPRPRRRGAGYSRQGRCRCGPIATPLTDSCRWCNLSRRSWSKSRGCSPGVERAGECARRSCPCAGTCSTSSSRASSR